MSIDYGDGFESSNAGEDQDQDRDREQELVNPDDDEEIRNENLSIRPGITDDVIGWSFESFRINWFQFLNGSVFKIQLIKTKLIESKLIQKNSKTQVTQPLLLSPNISWVG